MIKRKKDGWMDGGTDRRIDGRWMDERTDRYIHIDSYRKNLCLVFDLSEVVTIPTFIVRPLITRRENPPEIGQV